jgi:hypothetical protein
MMATALGHPPPLLSPSPSTSGQTRDDSNPRTTKIADYITAPRICQGISVWSFGYGLFRYVSVKRHLSSGMYVPATWGPVLLTVGSLAVFGTIGRHVDGRDRDAHDEAMRDAAMRRLREIFREEDGQGKV